MWRGAAGVAGERGTLHWGHLAIDPPHHLACSVTPRGERWHFQAKLNPPSHRCVGCGPPPFSPFLVDRRDRGRGAFHSFEEDAYCEL